MKQHFKLLIFDWDGTLMDSQGRIVTSFQSVIAEMKLEERPYATIRNIIGLGLDKAIATIYPLLNASERLHFADRYRTHFLDVNQLETPLFPNVSETMHHLHTLGYQLAVATGKSRAGLDRSMRESGLGPLFCSTRCAEETCSKPDPQMLHEIIDEMAMTTDDAVMIGDTEYDLEMANNAKMASIGVSYGVHEETRLLACHPLICLSDLAQLPQFLQQ